MIKSTKRGFTLIELLVVIAIIGMLAAVVVASMNSARMKARDAKRISEVDAIKKAMELQFDADTSYPAALTDINTKYLASLPKDPVSGANYTYESVPAGCDMVTTQCTDYFLGAVLEDTDNPALDGDADGVGATFDGTGPACTGGGTPDGCYDVRP